MKFAIYTLGCKVNQYESQAMERELLRRGYERGSFSEPCDLYIVNTCTVTAVSDRKSRGALRRARTLNPGAVVGVCGCYAQTRPEEMESLPVDVVGGSGQRIAFLDRMEQCLRDRQRSVQVDDALRRRDFEALEPGGLQTRTRALLKVEDGCANFCSYCIIPYARGAVRSLPLEEAVRQAEALRQRGYRELVITGIEISSWGQDLGGGETLRELISAVCRAVPEMRVRLGSLEPRTVDRAFCETLRDEENLCPQFHLSLQSGCGETLRAMRRRYGPDRFRGSCRMLRSCFPGCAVTTDLIVGFPGETEENFSESLSFVREMQFASVHVFPFSPRSGTPAAEMPGQIPAAEKERRAALAGSAARELKTAYQSQFVGKTLPVLFEQRNGDGLWTGHAPNGMLVSAAGEALRNQVRDVRITGIGEHGAEGALS